MWWHDWVLDMIPVALLLRLVAPVMVHKVRAGRHKPDYARIAELERELDINQPPPAPKRRPKTALENLLLASSPPPHYRPGRLGAPGTDYNVDGNGSWYLPPNPGESAAEAYMRSFARQPPPDK
jgi:hypothetical protein